MTDFSVFLFSLHTQTTIVHSSCALGSKKFDLNIKNNRTAVKTHNDSHTTASWYNHKKNQNSCFQFVVFQFRNFCSFEFHIDRQSTTTRWRIGSEIVIMRKVCVCVRPERHFTYTQVAYFVQNIKKRWRNDVLFWLLQLYVQRKENTMNARRKDGQIFFRILNCQINEQKTSKIINTYIVNQ